MTKENIIRQAYEAAVERYAAVGVDAREAMDKLQKISLSMHCWQADDVSGFENQGGSLTGGIQVTGNYPGRARTIDEVWCWRSSKGSRDRRCCRHRCPP